MKIKDLVVKLQMPNEMARTISIFERARDAIVGLEDARIRSACTWPWSVQERALFSSGIDVDLIGTQWSEQ